MNLFIATALLGIFFYNHDASAQNQKIIWGEEVKIGEGTAKSFVEMADLGIPVRIGIAFTPETLKGLPHKDTEFMLDLPKDVTVPPYDHFTMNWNPHGHEPTGVYDVPHFDYHFNYNTKSQQATITCMDTDAAACMKAPNPDYLVADYVPGPSGVPRMGWHWVDILSPEHHGHPFTATMVYGYYAGDTIFMEPMIALDYLVGKPNTTLPIRLPKKFPNAGYYPSDYSVQYKTDLGLYTVSFDHLKHLE